MDETRSHDLFNNIVWATDEEVFIAFEFILQHHSEAFHMMAEYDKEDEATKITFD